MKKAGWVGLMLVCAVVATSQERKVEKVVATVGSEKITAQQVEEEISRFTRPGFPGSGPGSNEARKRVLDQLVREKIFLKAATDANVKLTPQEEQQIEKMKTLLIIRKYVEEELKKKPVTEEEVKAYYEKNRDQFTIKERRKISQIVVKEEKQAEEILKKLKSGEDFAALARQYNTEGTGQKSGDAGWFSRESLPGEVAEVAFTLGKGETSGVVRSSSGFYLIKVEDIKPSQERPFEAVSQEIKRKLEQDRVKEMEVSLKQRYKVNVDYSALEASQK
ncbi:MAG TPA: peptidyl-prolyl cis-trans isomerase [bacterium]|nr:peptidyl-prolyl cis-trans isomerase [bacterium]HPP12435.1 peptidyl-prolyl cis-trans isomerase [bacterium]